MTKPDKLFKFISESSEKDVDVLSEELDQRFGETCAPVVIDSSGFTRTTRLRGPAYFLSIISHFRRICAEAAEKHNAIAYRFWADNCFAEFHTVDDAVAMALDVHRHFADNPIPLSYSPDNFGACIGIGFGRVLRSDNEGVYGDEMNLASKLGEDIAEPGQTLLTDNAFKALSIPQNFTIAKTTQTMSGVQMIIHNLKAKT